MFLNNQKDNISSVNTTFLSLICAATCFGQYVHHHS